MEEDKEILAISEKKDKWKKIINKTIYIVEFILAAIFMINYYQFKCNMVYNKQLSFVNFMLCCITGVSTLIIMFFIITKNRDKIEKIFVTIAIPVGMAYLIFLIPNHAVDETSHIHRSYEISKGILFAQTNEEGYIRTSIPKFFIDNNRETIRFYRDLNKQIEQKTDYSDEQVTGNPAYSYFPTLYFPNTIMFLIGRIFSLNGMITIYLARMVNFIVYMIFGYYIIKMIPFGKMLMMTYMLIPMAVHQAVSLSADCITNATMLFFIAYTLHLSYKEQITRKDKIIYIILSSLVSIYKLVYFPLILISLIFIGSKKMDKKQKTKFISIVITIGVILGISWILMSTVSMKEPNDYTIKHEVNPVEQIKSILTNPFGYIKVLIQTIFDKFDFYYSRFMGTDLGWGHIPIEHRLLDLYFLLLIFSPFMEKNKNELDKKTKLLFLLVFAIIFLLILTALYVMWSSVGESIIRGVQGRYFLPIAILLLLCLCGKERYIKAKNIEIIYPIMIVILNLNVVTQMSQYFL